MNANLKSSRGIVALLLLIGIGLSGCAGVVTAPSPALQQQIEGARSRADHEALVTHYNKEAATARAKATEHRQMGKSYQAAPAMGRGGGSMQAHCNSTANSYDEIASRYDAMAASHRELGVEAKP